jgi:hypothetical protein
MRDFLKRFWTVALTLAGIVALYLAALPLDLIWVFWAVVGLSAVVAGVTVVGPALLTLATRIRDYPRLLKTAAVSKVETESLRTQVRGLKSDIATRWEEGVAEGRQQVIGGILATRSDDPPELTGIDVASDGTLVLVAKLTGSSAPVGARYRVEVRSTGANRGVVEVIGVDNGRGKMTLACMHSAVQAFWDHLADRASFDSSPPSDVELVPEMVEIDSLVTDPDVYPKSQRTTIIDAASTATAESE